MAAFLVLEACFKGLHQLLGSFAVFGRMWVRSAVSARSLGPCRGHCVRAGSADSQRPLPQAVGFGPNAMTRIGPLHFGHCSYSPPGIQERVESHRSTTIQQFLL